VRAGQGGIVRGANGGPAEGVQTAGTVQGGNSEGIAKGVYKSIAKIPSTRKEKKTKKRGFIGRGQDCNNAKKNLYTGEERCVVKKGKSRKIFEPFNQDLKSVNEVG